MQLLRARLLGRGGAQARRGARRRARRAEGGGVGLADPQLHAAPARPGSRTTAPGYEVGDANRVLDGDLDGFVREYLLQQRATTSRAPRRRAAVARPTRRRARAPAAPSSSREAKSSEVVEHPGPDVELGLGARRAARRRARRSTSSSRISEPPTWSSIGGRSGEVARGAGEASGSVARAPPMVGPRRPARASRGPASRRRRPRSATAPRRSCRTTAERQAIARRQARRRREG